MYISAGLIPVFLLIRNLNMVGTFWVYIIPGMVSAWNIIIIRSYIENSIPDSLIESARMDGASEFWTLFKVVFPLSLPVIATVLLWNSVGQWNSWFDVMLYNNTKPNLSTLQYELQKVLMQTIQIQTVYDSAQMAMDLSGRRQTTTAQATRAAMTIVATLPILMAYPFLQKYFIHGLTIGGVKE
jgi:putative aldouronate transport system permease protein